MKVNILAFGIAKEIFGAPSCSMELHNSCNVNSLRHLLEEKFPRLRQLSSFRIAVNNHFATPDEVITEQDEIAIIPPVSGG